MHQHVDLLLGESRAGGGYVTQNQAPKPFANFEKETQNKPLASNNGILNR